MKEDTAACSAMLHLSHFHFNREKEALLYALILVTITKKEVP
ncbi:MAG: hypothetical protein OQK77_07645 [Psychromonas sp.]|nr:hypothetical protein [Psychromonas sp.]